MYTYMSTHQKKVTIVMAGWGTGGHALPIKSLLHYLGKHYTSHIHHIYWFWSKKWLEYRLYHEILHQKNHIPLTFVSLQSWKYRREKNWKSYFKNMADIVKFVYGCLQALFRLIWYHVDVVFCKWWYIALPVVIAWAILRKKVIVHESDTRPGLVNKIASRFAYKVFVGFEWVLPKSQVVGQILSDEIIVDTLPPTSPKTTCLIIGWSQWAKKLYEAVLHILTNSRDIHTYIDFIIVLGVVNQDMKKYFEQLPHVKVYDFVDQQQMGILYAQSDIVVTRAWTTSLAEQILYNIKQIIVPIPWTHDQYTNASWYVQHHQAIGIDQKDKDFEKHLKDTLWEYRSYKKSFSKEQLQKNIHHIQNTKQQICDAIVGKN